jgi:hypothetical protein
VFGLSIVPDEMASYSNKSLIISNLRPPANRFEGLKANDCPGARLEPTLFSAQPRKRKNLRKYRVDQNATSEREVNHSVDVKNTQNA